MSNGSSLKQELLKSLPAKLLLFGPTTIAAYFDALEIPFLVMLYGFLFILIWELIAHYIGHWLTAFLFAIGQIIVMYLIGHYG